MAGTLFVRAGRDRRRQVFAEQGRGLWSDALAVVLEKHGYQTADAEPSVLGDRDALREADVVLVSALGAEQWTPEVIRTVSGCGRPVLLGGGVPDHVADALGIAVGAEIEPDGQRFVACDEDLWNAAAGFGHPVGGRISTTGRIPLEIEDQLLWHNVPTVPLTEAQAVAWRAEAWDIRDWTVEGGGTVLCQLVDADDPTVSRPAVVRTGRVVACCMDLFSFLVQRHSAEPTDGGEWSRVLQSLGIEVIVLGIIDLMYRWARATRIRVLPWPAGQRAARAVRQEVAVKADMKQLTRRAEGLFRRGLASTWFWTASAAERDQIAAVTERPGQEIAMSGERLWGAERSRSERAILSAAAGLEPVGLAAHASPDCFRFQGAPNILWAEREGLRYVELPVRSHFHPHRFVSLLADGELVAPPVLCLPAAESLADSERLTERLALFRAVGGLLQLDVPLGEADPAAADPLELLPTSDSDEIVGWTLRDVTRWWWATHVGGELSLVAGEDGTWQAIGTADAAGVELELLAPDGERDVISPDLMIRSGSGAVGALPPVMPSDWAQCGHVIEAALHRYWETAPPQVEESFRQRVLTANTEAVPGRAEQLLGLGRELIGVDDFAGTTVLALRAGIGTVSCYLALEHGVRAICLELEPSIRALAEQIIFAAGLARRVTFVAADTEPLSAVAEESIDLVIAEDALHGYLGRRDLRDLLNETHRVLRPGGALLVSQTLRAGLADVAAVDSSPLPGIDPGVVKLDRLEKQLARTGFTPARVALFGIGGRINPGAELAVRYALGTTRRH